MTAIEQDPSWDQPYEILGNIYADQNDEKAIKYFENAYKVNPQNNSAIIQKAEFYPVKALGYFWGFPCFVRWI